MPAPSRPPAHLLRPLARRAGAAVLSLAVAAAVLAVGAGPAAADTALCDRFAATAVDGGRYTVQNNRWGTDATQCTTARDGGFRVERADGAVVPAGPPKSYPSIVAGCHYGRCSTAPGLPVRASEVGGARTAVSIDRAPGRWNAAYDVWFDSRRDPDGQNDTAELMIWIDRGGDPAPIGSPRGQVGIDGTSWTVWQGPMSGSGKTWQVVSFVRDAPTTDVDLALAPFVDEAARRGALGPGSWMTSVQFGFEPWVGGAGLTARGFSWTPDGAQPAAAPPAPAPGPSPDPGTGADVAADGVVVGAASGRCLDVAGSSRADAAKVQLWDCNGTGAQRWRADGGRLVNVASGTCLDVARASARRGARVQQWTCLDDGPGQQWRSRADGSVVNPASGLCLDAAGQATRRGTPLKTWTCRSGQGNQTWR